jgi:hypothetical protein
MGKRRVALSGAKKNKEEAPRRDDRTAEQHLIFVDFACQIWRQFFAIDRTRPRGAENPLNLEAQKGMRKAWQIRRIQKVIKSDTHVGV